MNRIELALLLLIGLFMCEAYGGEDYFPEDGNWVGKPRSILCHKYAGSAVDDLKTMRTHPKFAPNGNDQWLTAKLEEWRENGQPTRDFEALVFANCMGGKEV